MELEGLDIRLLRRRQRGGIGELDVLEAVEELEADAALFEHFVERRKHHVAHTAVHAPEQAAAVGEQHAEGSAQRCSGGEARALEVAVFVRERQRVDSAHERRVQRRVGRAVEPQPVAPIVVVDRVEAARIGQQAEAHDALHGGEHHVDDFPQAACLVVALGEHSELAPRVRADAVDQMEHRVLGILRQRPEHELEHRHRLHEAGHRRHHTELEDALDRVADRLAGW